MPSIEELREAVVEVTSIARLDYDKEGLTPYGKALGTLLSLAKQYLASGGVAKMSYRCDFNDKLAIPPDERAFRQGWNACFDAVRLAGWRKVPSAIDIAEIINKEPLPNEGHKWAWANKLATAIHDLMLGESREKQ